MRAPPEYGPRRGSHLLLGVSAHTALPSDQVITLCHRLISSITQRRCGRLATSRGPPAGSGGLTPC
ncbi:hypothetical protein BN2537_11031 [Streptomyces venezuelae]|nr:hypothetical protein BN2537_11031 [Streptomyces venezuelae]